MKGFKQGAGARRPNKLVILVYIYLRSEAMERELGKSGELQGSRAEK